MTLQIGHMLGRYRIAAHIGAGGMGEVYRAHDAQLDRDIAVKVIGEALATDHHRLERLETEARAAARLSHPNVVTVHSVEEDGGTWFITMELVDGETLDRIIPPTGLPLARILEIGRTLADAIAYAHERGVTHLDLKPRNVMIDRSGRLRVLDFGLAALRDPDASGEDLETAPLASSEPSGTIPYMAPEQLEGAAADPRMDVFAIGAVLYELASGSRAFDRPSPVATAAAILRDDPPALETLRLDLPPDLVRIVRRCLRKEPTRRVQTARDVMNELRDIEETAGGGHAGKREAQGLVERCVTLDADAIRGLDGRSPRMIRDVMTYLDNGVVSDTLVIYLPGLGLDQRMFTPTLLQASHHAVAVSPYGFGPTARHRPALSIDDHSRLLRVLFRDLDRRFKQTRRVVAGFSAGADHAMRMAASADGFGIPIDALLALGLNIHLDTCQYSQAFENLPADTNATELVALLRELGREFDDLPTWLIFHDYLVQIFSKFGNDARPLARYATDLVEPFRRAESPFVDWYRAAVSTVGVLRIVGTRQDQPYIDEILMRHLDEGVLGPDYREETIELHTDLEHLELSGADFLLQEVETTLRAVEARGAHGR